jgi:hypothetical protein
MTWLGSIDVIVQKWVVVSKFNVALSLFIDLFIQCKPADLGF